MDHSKNITNDRRKMTQASLLGSHSHATKAKKNVTIWLRSGKYIARGRIGGKAFGPTLGDDVKSAEIALRRVLAEIDDDRFERSSAKSKQLIKTLTPERLTFLDLCNRFITEKQKLRGLGTATDYRSRLMHAIRFAERRESRSRWPYARDIDREFAIGLRECLYSVSTTRNGKPGASLKPLSPRQIYNILECIRSVINWAVRPDIRLLPLDFVSPFSQEIVGDKPRKDPLRSQILPLPLRIDLVKKLDCWQLATIGLLSVLPLRPEELQGIMISDIDFRAQTLRVGTRYDGADFTKGKTNTILLLPKVMLPILYACVGDRVEGPLLLRRAVWGYKRIPKLSGVDREGFQTLLQERLVDQKNGSGSANDRKKVTRKLLNEFGALDKDQLNKEFKLKIVESTGVRTNLYQLRHAVSTDMNHSGMPFLELRYLTGHATDDIMNTYVSLDPHGELQKYFGYVSPLLEAIERRGEELGCTTPINENGVEEIVETYESV